MGQAKNSLCVRLHVSVHPLYHQSTIPNKTDSCKNGCVEGRKKMILENLAKWHSVRCKDICCTYIGINVSNMLSVYVV